MILHAYGDSWTEGQGSDYEHELSLIEREDKKTFRNEHSWVKSLSDKLGISYVNHGISGNANNKIFNAVVNDIKNNKVASDDFIIIMWSSSLRDNVPFLPDGEWVTWSIKHLLNEPHKFINSHVSENECYDDFFTKYKEFFLSEMFNQNYYNIVNQNYIIFLQKLLNHNNIKYMMCDSFESMLVDLNKKDDITHLIDTSKYWNFDKKTFRDFLNETKRLDVWEFQDVNFMERTTQHPNKEGYKLIAKELYNFIKQNKTITQ
jgi:hypothetical protein